MDIQYIIPQIKKVVRKKLQSGEKVAKWGKMVNLLIAIPYKIQNLHEWERIISLFDEKEYFIYEIEGVNSNNFDLGSLINVVEQYKTLHDNINKIVVLSNLKEFIFSWYRCYNSLVDDYVYCVEDESISFFCMEDETLPLYYNLYEFNRIEFEKTEGKIYINRSLEKNEPVYYYKKYFKCFYDFDYFDKKRKDKINKKYELNGLEYCFTIDSEIKYETTIILDRFQVDSKVMNRISCLMGDGCSVLNKYFSGNELSEKCLIEATSILKNLDEKLTELSNDEKRQIEFIIKNQMLKADYCDKFKIFLGSILYCITSKENYIEFILNMLLNSTELTKYNKFFVYYQCVRYIMVNKSVSIDTRKIRNSVFEDLHSEFKVKNIALKKLSLRERNDDCIFVFAGQIVSMHHAPTKIAMDVCWILANKYRKKIYLINTREVATDKGSFPMKNTYCGNIVIELSKNQTIKYKGEEFLFYQPEVSMPDDDEIKKMLNLVNKYKPELIINIGPVMTGDLCSEIVPTVTLPLSGETFSNSTFLVNFNETMYRQFNSEFGIKKERVIFAKGAFELKPKEYNFTKEELRIPKNKFIIIVVGNRLNEEMDDGFIKVLDRCCKISNGFVLFVGSSKIEKDLKRYKYLWKNHKNLGYQDDLLAVIEHTDLYINPKRSGGGTSVIYAFYAGKPVITLEYGDVFIYAEKDFAVRNYDEMNLKIDRYVNDQQFYTEKSLAARNKGLELTNFENYICSVYEQVIKNNLFF